MRFIVPFAPQSAMRPNYSSETGRPSHMFMPKTYRKWRDETNLWFEDWLFDTDYRLLKECLYLDDGRNIRNLDTGRFQPDFCGYALSAVFVVKARKDGKPFPLSRPDIDNYAKALTDMIFESRSFKNAELDDKLIQSMNLLKRCAKEGEEPHFEAELKML